MHTVATFFKQMCSKFDENNKSFPPETRTLAYLNNKENKVTVNVIETRDVLRSKRPQNMRSRFYSQFTADLQNFQLMQCYVSHGSHSLLPILCHIHLQHKTLQSKGKDWPF